MEVQRDLLLWFRVMNYSWSIRCTESLGSWPPGRDVSCCCVPTEHVMDHVLEKAGSVGGESSVLRTAHPEVMQLVGLQPLAAHKEFLCVNCEVITNTNLRFCGYTISIAA